MDEFEIIRRYFTPVSTDPAVRIGVGDDGAVLRVAPDRDLVTVVDTMVADVHFPLSLPPADVGYRAVAVNLSDIAAMGGRARWMTLALTLAQADPDWLEQFSRGLLEAADEAAVILVGGDMTRGEQTVMSVQITGDIPSGQALTRSGARPGDGIFVTGTVGDAAAGLASLQDGTSSDAAQFLARRFARPTARLAVGQWLLTRASAAIDLSDGLFTDLGKLLTASGVAGNIEVGDIPLSPQMRSAANADEALQYALAGGDDYELCFTARDDALPHEGMIAGVAFTRIGRVGGGKGLSCTRGGRAYAFSSHGYRHFE